MRQHLDGNAAQTATPAEEASAQPLTRSTDAEKSSRASRPAPAVLEAACALRADEVAVLALLAEGLPLDAVARQLTVSERTLRRRTRAICDLLGVPATIAAVAWAARRGLL